MKWIFNQRNRIIAEKQVTGKENSLEDKFEMISRSEYRAYKPYLRIESGLTVMDLACGLGRVSVYLADRFKCLGFEIPHFILGDSDTKETGDDLKYGYAGQPEFYNSFDESGLFLEENHIPKTNYEFFDVLKQDYSEFAGRAYYYLDAWAGVPYPAVRLYP